MRLLLEAGARWYWRCAAALQGNHSPFAMPRYRVRARECERVLDGYRLTYGYGETFLHATLAALGVPRTDAAGWLLRPADVALFRSPPLQVIRAPPPTGVVRLVEALNPWAYIAPRAAPSEDED